jgi:hypothetical protein
MMGRAGACHCHLTHVGSSMLWLSRYLGSSPCMQDIAGRSKQQCLPCHLTQCVLAVLALPRWIHNCAFAGPQQAAQHQANSQPGQQHGRVSSMALGHVDSTSQH